MMVKVQKLDVPYAFDSPVCFRLVSVLCHTLQEQHVLDGTF